MELYHSILASYFSVSHQFNQEINPAEIVEGQCYQAISKIRAVLADDQLDDPECFSRIEQIVCIMEELGVGAGNRHDFG